MGALPIPMWTAPRQSGARYGVFWYAGRRIAVKAAPCVQAEWPGEPESSEWTAARDVWAAEQVERICYAIDNPEIEVEAEDGTVA